MKKKLTTLLVFAILISFLTNAQSDMQWTLEYHVVKPCLFKDDVYWVYQDNKTSLMDKNGKELIPFNDGSFYIHYNNRFCIMTKGTSLSLYDIETKFTIPYSAGYESFVVKDSVIQVFDRNHKWGILDLKGNVVLPCKYNKMSHFERGFAAVSDEDGKEGIINTRGEVIIPLKYELKGEVNFYKDVFVMKRQDAMGMVNTKGEVICPFRYKNLYFGDGSSKLATFEENDLWGYINNKGEIIVVAKYKFANSFYKGVANVQNQDNLWGYVNEEGSEYIPCQFLESQQLVRKYESVKLSKNQHIFINHTGKKVLDTIFGNSGFFINENLAFIRSLPFGKYGLYHKSKRQILPPQYEIEKNSTLIMAKSNEKFMLLDTSGRFIDTFEGCADFYNFGFDYKFPVGVKKNGKWGLIDKTGKLIADYQYDEVTSFGEGHFMFVRKNGKWGVIDKKMQVLIPFEYDAPIDAKVSKAMIMLQNGKQGVINEKGITLIPFSHNKIEQLIEGKLFIVFKNSLQGVIDTKNKLIVPIQYDEIRVDNKRKYLLVKVNNKYGIIGLDGKVLIATEYDIIKSDFSDDYYIPANGLIVSKQNNCGYANFQNKLIIPCEYKSIEWNKGDFGIAKNQNGSFDLYNSTGTLLGKSYKSILGNKYISSKLDFVIVENFNNQFGVFFMNGDSLPCEYKKIKMWKRENPLFIAINQQKNACLFDNKGKKVKNYDKGEIGNEFSNNFVSFTNDAISSTLKYKTGLIDTLGNFVLEPIYDIVTKIDKSSFFLQKDSNALIFDTNIGKILTVLQFSEIKNFFDNETQRNFFLCKSDSKYGVINKNGGIIFPFEYDNIKEEYLRKQVLVGIKNGKKYVLNLNGFEEQIKE